MGLEKCCVTSFIPTKSIRIFSLGLNEDEAKDKLYEWNERNAIELPSDELQNVARSAYQRRFPYRFSWQDGILRRFCPLPKYDSCRKLLETHAPSRIEATLGNDGQSALARMNLAGTFSRLGEADEQFREFVEPGIHGLESCGIRYPG